jgi:hypothetical protein
VNTYRYARADVKTARVDANREFFDNFEAIVEDDASWAYRFQREYNRKLKTQTTSISRSKIPRRGARSRTGTARGDSPFCNRSERQLPLFSNLARSAETTGEFRHEYRTEAISLSRLKTPMTFSVPWRSSFRPNFASLAAFSTCIATLQVPCCLAASLRRKPCQLSEARESSRSA